MIVNGVGLKEIIRLNSKVDINNNDKTQTSEKSTKDIKIDIDCGEPHNTVRTNMEKSSESVFSSKEEVMQAADNESANQIKQELKYLSNNVTAADGAELEKEGYSLEEDDVKAIVTVVDKIKIKMAMSNKDFQNYGDSIDSSQIEQMTGSVSMASSVEHKLTQNDIPCSDENLDDIVKAQEMLASLEGTDITDSVKKYMLDNDLEPTINNIYKASHSVSNNVQSPTNLSEDTWNEIKGQAEEIIKSSGLEVNEETLDDAKWLIENDIPLTKENLNKKIELDSINIQESNDKVLDSMAQAIVDGKRPQDALLAQTQNIDKRALDAVTIINDAAPADVDILILQNKEVTINNLKEAAGKIQINETAADANDVIQNESDTGVNENENNNNESDSSGNSQQNDQNYEAIKYKRALEELRLLMTAQASVSMLKKGIEIETQPLSDLVENLKAQERQFYATILETQNIEPTQENIDILKNTSTVVAETKNVPEYVLGQNPFVSNDASSITVDNIHSEGTKLQAKLEAVGEKYETLMTSPRADMGDSINKAFSNIENILSDLGIENSETNNRAVRILAYNNTEITKENIETIKQADVKVNNVLKGLTPSVTMQMIKKNINPLDMNLNELQNTIDEIKAQTDPNDTERFSEYLWKLEQNTGMTKEERDSYIGIYRIINNVEKTDGAVIGALINQNADITMKNLMTAVRTRRNNGIDVKIDDDFGMLDSDNMSTLEITHQAESAFSNESQDGQNQQNILQYNTDLLKKIMNSITPQKVSDVVNNNNIQDMTLEQFAEQIETSEETENLNKQYTAAKLEQLGQLSDVESSVMKMLSDNNITTNMYNIMAANQMTNKRNTWFKTVLDAADNETGTDDLKEQILEEFGEAIKTPQEMAEAMEKLAQTAENVMKTMISSEDISSDGLKEIKIMRSQLNIMDQLSQDEHYSIPVLIGDEITGISLKICRGGNKEEKGKVNIAFETENNGKTAAQIVIKENRISGIVACENTQGADILKENSEGLNNILQQENNVEQENIDINYIVSSDLDINSFMTNFEITNNNISEDNEEYQVQTKELYQAAKTFISYVKSSYDRYNL